MQHFVFIFLIYWLLHWLTIQILQKLLDRNVISLQFGRSVEVFSGSVSLGGNKIYQGIEMKYWEKFPFLNCSSSLSAAKHPEIVSPYSRKKQNCSCCSKALDTSNNIPYYKSTLNPLKVPHGLEGVDAILSKISRNSSESESEVIVCDTHEVVSKATSDNHIP